jgi:hypothetical protein
LPTFSCVYPVYNGEGPRSARPWRCNISASSRSFIELTPPTQEIAADYWIIVHRDLRRAACVRAAIDWIKALFAEQRDVLAGRR